MRNKYIIVILALIFILITILIGVSQNSKPVSNKIKVIATTTQISDFVKNIAGDKVELSTIFGPDIDPHEYDPTSDDIKSLNLADVIFLNGAGLEHKLQKNLDDSNVFKVTLSDKVTIINNDPHIWHSVANAKIMINEIADKLIELDPLNAEFYDSNRDSYLVQLDDLDKYITDRIAELQASNRKIVTNHDAFGYYVNQYNLDFVGSIIPGLSTETEPTAQETSELIQKIKEQNVKAIFTENTINPKLSEQIAKDAKVKIISDLYGDTLGAPGSNGDSYIKMMKFNTDRIVDNLK